MNSTTSKISVEERNGMLNILDGDELPNMIELPSLLEKSLIEFRELLGLGLDVCWETIECCPIDIEGKDACEDATGSTAPSSVRRLGSGVFLGLCLDNGGVN